MRFHVPMHTGGQIVGQQLAQAAVKRIEVLAQRNPARWARPWGPASAPRAAWATWRARSWIRLGGSAHASIPKPVDLVTDGTAAAHALHIVAGQCGHVARSLRGPAPAAQEGCEPMAITVRQATKDDATTVALFIVELARDERLELEARPNVAHLQKHLSGDGGGPRLHCLIAQDGHEPVGFATYYFSFSTLEASWGLHVEDLFVRREHRGKGAGKALLRGIGEIALAGDTATSTQRSQLEPGVDGSLRTPRCAPPVRVDPHALQRLRHQKARAPRLKGVSPLARALATI